MLYLNKYLIERDGGMMKKIVLITGILTILIAISTVFFYRVNAEGKLNKQKYTIDYTNAFLSWLWKQR